MTTQGKGIQKARVRIPYSSLASQAVGRPGSPFEMSFAGRTFPDIGQKLLDPKVVPLGMQLVHPRDSVLDMRVPPMLEALSLAEVEHNSKNNRTRAKSLATYGMDETDAKEGQHETRDGPSQGGFVAIPCECVHGKLRKRLPVARVSFVSPGGASVQPTGQH